MADSRYSPPFSPPRSPPPTPTATPLKSPNKRKTTATASTPANKNPNNPPPTAAETEDTATSKANKGMNKKIIQEFDFDDIEVYEKILEYRNKKGVFPFESPTAMKNFLLPWIILCIGNEAGWKMKLEHVKNKFTKDSDPINEEEIKEFDLWKKIWGNEVEGGDEYDPDENSTS